MASTPEKKVKDKVVKLLKAHGIYYFFPATFGMGRSGVPDIICCFGGKFLAIECKAQGKQPTALQDREINAIRTAQGIAAVARETNLDMIEQILKELTDDSTKESNS